MTPRRSTRDALARNGHDPVSQIDCEAARRANMSAAAAFIRAVSLGVVSRG